ncbi:ABC transporter permease [Salinispira pacifica]|uniref:ABC transporter permease protein n=1 Tax=Salinispira pacifica TaxID=1307761 RepID=V5WE57_9SPIO|nr:ABC transporter permease [Salinispira pacifica]AHC14067.1 ABC transporter permease protein [Salinispira pacifica]
MKRILTLMKIDITNALRDSLVVYVIAAPILLAIGLRLFLPGVQGSVLTYAVQVPADAAQLSAEISDSQGPEIIEKAGNFADALENYGMVERYETADAVRDRVARNDSVGGFFLDSSGSLEILLEGNEEGDSEAIMQAVYAAAIRGSLSGEYEVEQTGSGSPIREYASVGMVMLASLIGGLAVAFAMVDEKEQNVTKAFTVSPLRSLDYFASRGLLAGIIGLAAGTAGHYILMGGTVPASHLMAALLASAPLPLLVALLVGGIAKNQIQAVAALKVVMMIYFTLPFVSIAVPRSWHWLFFAFPNYWMFRSFEDLYVTGARMGDLPLAASLTFASGLIALLALGFALRRQLKPRQGQ